MSDVYILSAKRSPIGRLGGGLAKVSAAELGVVASKAALSVLPDGADVDEVIFGNVLGAGCGMNVARQVSLGCGLDVSVPAFVVNKVCGSGLKAITLGAQSICAGQADLILAGGTESMSQAPYLLSDARAGYRFGDGKVLDGILRDGLTDVFSGRHMGELTEALAQRMEISRADQDAFSLRSQRNWAGAEVAHAEEIVPVDVRTRKGVNVVARDEHPRPDTTAETLAALKPAFAKDGTITAGNASGVNDGAAAVLLASKAGLEKTGLTPIAKLTAWSSAGVSPEEMGLGPIAAVRKLLDQTGLGLESIDKIELNEAFAAQSLACIRQLQLDPDKVNVHGGAIAMGHPIGASGARIVVTLLNVLQRTDGRKGLATLCIGGGMGMAAVFERCE